MAGNGRLRRRAALMLYAWASVHAVRGVPFCVFAFLVLLWALQKQEALLGNALALALCKNWAAGGTLALQWGSSQARQLDTGMRACWRAA